MSIALHAEVDNGFESQVLRPVVSREIPSAFSLTALRLAVRYTDSQIHLPLAQFVPEGRLAIARRFKRWGTRVFLPSPGGTTETDAEIFRALENSAYFSAQLSSLKPQAYVPQASSLKPHASSLKPHASLLLSFDTAHPIAISALFAAPEKNCFSALPITSLAGS